MSSFFPWLTNIPRSSIVSLKLSVIAIISAVYPLVMSLVGVDHVELGGSLFTVGG